MTTPTTAPDPAPQGPGEHDELMIEYANAKALRYIEPPRHAAGITWN
jgi:hypothetical protein